MSHFLAFDLETTGIDPFYDVPVSYAFVETNGRALTTSTNYVYPGGPIPPEASAIHGITDDVVKNGLSLEFALVTIVNRLRKTWNSGGVVVGMNVSYDLTMVAMLTRALLHPQIWLANPGPTLDVLVIDRKMDKWRKGSRKLEALCERYHVENPKAHDATGDCLATLGVLHAQFARWPYLRAKLAGKETQTMTTWHQEWCTSFTKYLVAQGREPLPEGQWDWPIHARTTSMGDDSKVRAELRAYRFSPQSS